MDPTPPTPWEHWCVKIKILSLGQNLSECREEGAPLYAGFTSEEVPVTTIPPVSQETQVRIVLSILNAHTEDPQPPWGVTMLGWQTYAKHPDQRVREAVARHPDKFQKVSYAPPRLQRMAAAAE